MNEAECLLQVLKIPELAAITMQYGDWPDYWCAIQASTISNMTMFCIFLTQETPFHKYEDRDSTLKAIYDDRWTTVYNFLWNRLQLAYMSDLEEHIKKAEAHLKIAYSLLPHTLTFSIQRKSVMLTHAQYAITEVSVLLLFKYKFFDLLRIIIEVVGVECIFSQGRLVKFIEKEQNKEQFKWITEKLQSSNQKMELLLACGFYEEAEKYALEEKNELFHTSSSYAHNKILLDAPISFARWYAKSCQQFSPLTWINHTFVLHRKDQKEATMIMEDLGKSFYSDEMWAHAYDIGNISMIELLISWDFTCPYDIYVKIVQSGNIELLQKVLAYRKQQSPIPPPFHLAGSLEMVRFIQTCPFYAKIGLEEKDIITLLKNGYHDTIKALIQDGSISLEQIHKLQDNKENLPQCCLNWILSVGHKKINQAHKDSRKSSKRSKH